MNQAQQLGRVSKACRQFGISRSLLCRWGTAWTACILAGMGHPGGAADADRLAYAGPSLRIA